MRIYRGAVVLLAVSSAAFASQPVLSTGLISVDSIRPITALPLNSPPINGYTPQVVFGLTDQWDANGEENYASVPSALPDGGNTLPIGSSPYYTTGIFDVGSQSDLIDLEDEQKFNFASANRGGDSQAEIQGASGTEETNISDPIGVYATGFQNATVANNIISAPQSAFLGQWNTSVLTTQSAPSDVPNLIGAPMAAQYQTVISNSQTVRLTINGQTLRSPQVTFQAQDTAIPKNDYRLSLSVQSPFGNFPDPEYFPNLDGTGENAADNPSTPSFWESFFASVNASGSGGSISGSSFLLDSGSQVTVLSEDTAASVGFYTGGPNPSTPAFYVTVSGVGGPTENVPGFYLPTLSITTNGGPITWTNVPVIVLDLPNPATGSGSVAGILGTNLFTDRDLILNGDVNTPWLGISPLLTPQWNSDSNGNWGDDSKWIMGVPDADVQDAPANFLSAITAARTITVDANYTAGSITFNNTHSYTLAGPGTLTLANSTGTASIEVITGSHTISAPLSFSNNTNIKIDSASSTLSLTGGISAASVTTSKLGPGMLILGSSSNQFGTLDIQQAALQFPVSSNDIVNGITISSDSALRGSIAAGYDQGKWDGPGIRSSTAAITPGTGLGYSDAAGNFTIELTWLGDANLDGLVNSLDLTAISATGTTWSTGDFNYDGKVNADDYSLYMLGDSISAGRNSSILVPEPGIALLGIAAFFLPRRRLYCS